MPCGSPRRAGLGAHDPEGALAFGPERVLDGIAVFIEGKQR